MTLLLGDAAGVSASADALGTRPTWCLLTDPSVESTLPRVASGLKGFLRARGVAPCEIDDYVQESLRKAIAKQVPYSTPDQLLAWCLIVARNMVVDDCRRRARRRHLVVTDERIGDAETEVLARLGALAVLAAVRQLPEADQEATRVVPQDRRESNRLAKRRARARMRLRDILAGGLAAAWLAGRRFSQAGSAGIVAAACVAITLSQAMAPSPEPLPLTSPNVQIRDQVRVTVTQRQPQPRTLVVVAKVPRPNSPARRKPTERLTVVEPRGAGQGVYVDEREQTPADRLVCANNVPVVGRICSPR